MDGEKGSAPEKVRPYRLDYRPLIDRDLTDKAISFMRRQAKADKPFFVYLPYTATHFPTMPHPDFVGKSGNGPWGDLLMQIDSYVGELLETIDGRQRSGGVERRRNVNDGRNCHTRLFRSVAFNVIYRLRGCASRTVRGALAAQDRRGSIAGGKVPTDRVIDGIDMSEFFLGSAQESGREGFIVYMGNDVFGVKWRDWKLHFKEQTGWNGVLREYTMPRLYNLINDPQERDNVLFPHTWVPKAALPQLQEHVLSLRKNPPIPSGAPDPYKPPSKE
jgi:arylsulfatase